MSYVFSWYWKDLQFIYWAGPNSEFFGHHKFASAISTVLEPSIISSNDPRQDTVSPRSLNIVVIRKKNLIKM